MAVFFFYVLVQEESSGTAFSKALSAISKDHRLFGFAKLEVRLSEYY